VGSKERRGEKLFILGGGGEEGVRGGERNFPETGICSGGGYPEMNGRIAKATGA